MLAGVLALPQAWADEPLASPPAGAAPALPTSTAVQDAPAPPDGQRVWSQAPTVQDLVRLDLEAALAQRRGQWQAPGEPPRAGMPSAGGKPDAPALRLAAIYGVGRQLQAELLSEGRRVVLRAGGGTAPQGLRLLSIDGECVRVRARDDVVHALCLARAEAS
ncbi:hypothetical protein ANT2_1825 [plant metagenome]|uniref:Type IV pilus biogenesis protein PilP n=1 Tax=plant metagenome TaxID=1297885 RepID=A0A484RE42_9ZZZZ